MTRACSFRLSRFPTDLILWGVVLTAACETPEVDLDGDGWVASEDCDDDDWAVHPSMNEACNGRDDDCDGEIDDGVLVVLYADTDGDGYGSVEEVMACPGAPDTSTRDDDCDDSDASVHELVTSYVDADGDGFGDPATTVEECGTPSGVVDDATDCDDGDPTIHPGAGEAPTCDGIDSDCNGIDCLPASVVAAWNFEGDADDASGNGNDGTVQGAELTSDRNGAPDAAFHFDGVSAYIDVPNSESLDSIEEAGAVTVAAWIYVEDLDSGGFALFEKWNASIDACFEYMLWGGNMQLAIGAAVATEPYTPAFDQWLFVAVTYDETVGGATFYADGELVDTVPYSGSFGPTAGAPGHIGWSDCGGDEYSAGTIDDLYVFASALSDDEIADLYAL